MQFFADRFRFVRYDERGCGMTDWQVGDLSVERWVEDLEAVVEAAEVREPFALLGISQGAADLRRLCRAASRTRVAPRALRRLCARRRCAATIPDQERRHHAITETARVGWADDNPAFRQVFTSRFIPDGDGRAGEVVQRAVPQDDVGGRSRRRCSTPARRWTSRRCSGRCASPTLVLHGRDDNVVPIAEGRLLAAGIPGAEFVELDSRNHVLLEHEPAWQRFRDAVCEFLGRGAERRRGARRSPRCHRASARSSPISPRDLSNAEIAERLAVSEKTVRNHVSHLFDKLGVWTRAQAMVYARDHHFKA